MKLENENLKEKLIEIYEQLNIKQNQLENIQVKLIETQNKLMLTEGELNENQKILELTEVNEEVGRKYKEDLEKALLQVEQLKEEMYKLRKRGLFDRIFNRE